MPESFERTEKTSVIILLLSSFRTIVLSNHRFYQPKQTRLPITSHSLSSNSRNEYCRVQWQKHQVLFNKAPEPHLLCKKTFSFHLSPICIYENFKSILCQLLFKFSFQVRMKTLIGWRICLATEVDFQPRLLIWMVIILLDSDGVLSNVELRG